MEAKDQESSKGLQLKTIATFIKKVELRGLLECSHPPTVSK